MWNKTPKVVGQPCNPPPPKKKKKKKKHTKNENTNFLACDATAHRTPHYLAWEHYIIFLPNITACSADLLPNGITIC